MRIKVFYHRQYCIYFPVTDAELNLEMRKMGIYEKIPKCKVVEVLEKDNPLELLTGNVLNLDEVNFFARRMESLTEYEREVLSVYTEIHGADTVKDLINLTYSTKGLSLITDFSDPEQVGKRLYVDEMQVLSEEEKHQNNFVQFAEKTIQESSVELKPYEVFIEHGFELQEVYNGKTFPEYFYSDKIVAAVEVKNESGDTDYLYLPADICSMDKLKKRLNERYFCDLKLTAIHNMHLPETLVPTPQEIADIMELTSFNELCHEVSGFGKEKMERLAIELDTEYMEHVLLKTEQVLLEDTEFVYPAGTGKYYVKADEETEHTLKLAGYTVGKATNHYQIDWLRMVSLSGTMEEWYQAKVPRVNVETGSAEFANEELTNDASGMKLLFLEPTSATAWRSDATEKVGLNQKVVIGAENDGKQIMVYPKAMAEFESEEYWSDQEEDSTHGLTLIPDGKAPVITGIEALQNAGNIDMTEEKKDFIITATDEGSGMRELIVIITNLDNQMQRTYETDTGELVIIMEKEDYLFLGDFVVSAEASDNVGNVNLQGSDSLAFTMEADLKRTREPQNGNFRAGDGAILTITTGGYADKIIVRFPDELTSLKPELNQEYVYEFPEVIKTEMYEFNIPLATPGGEYMIEVEAWKDNRKLTEELALPIRTNGSIVDEFRTRIRDNGV